MIDSNAAFHPLRNVIWRALHGSQAHLAEINGLARRYRNSVAPFASLDENSDRAVAELAALVPDGDAVFVLGEKPRGLESMRLEANIPLLQMVFPPELALPEKEHDAPIEELTCDNTADMMELIAIAFPGYFREETCRMGRYFGIREQGKLIGMCGERMVFDADGVEWRELSALATHPQHTGQGLGTLLMQHVLRMQRELGAISFLHVIESNTSAIRLYERFGFETAHRVELHKLIRNEG